MSDANAKEPEHLVRSVKAVHLWGLAVGAVISGEYFGWSYGFGTGGPIGLLLACIPVAILYTAFIFCYSELATMIPHAGGPSAYARRAMGPFAGYIAGISCLIEFVFAPPAIALAIGGYIHFLIPIIPSMMATVVAVFAFIGINLLGMKTSSRFELAMTVLASIGLCLFVVVAIPHYSTAMVLKPLAQSNGLDGMFALIPNGWAGVMASIPFAIWFFLAIEGAAMASEEVVNPQKDIPKGFLSGMATLIVAAVAVLVITAGIVDYTTVAAVDFPLPAALASIFGESSWITIAVNLLGLAGLIASIHGIIIGYSRQTYAMARTGYLPKFLGAVNHKYHSPHWALIVPGVIIVFSALTGLTAMVISISCIGSVALYLMCLISFIVLRVKEPNLPRPFKVKWGIGVWAIAMVTCLFCAYSIIVYSLPGTLLWSGIVFGIALLWYAVEGRKDILPFEEEFNQMDKMDEVA